MIGKDIRWTAGLFTVTSKLMVNVRMGRFREEGETKQQGRRKENKTLII